MDLKYILYVLTSLLIIACNSKEKISTEESSEGDKSCKTRYNSNQDLIDSVCFVDGLLQGKTVSFDSLWNGYHVCYFVDDTIHGNDTMFDQTRENTIFVGSYFKGYRNNNMNVFKNGKLSEFRLYDYGNPIFNRRYKANGKFKEEGKPGYVKYFGDSIISDNKAKFGLKYGCPPDTDCILGVIEISGKDTVYGGIELARGENIKSFIHNFQHKGIVELKFRFVLLNNEYEDGRNKIDLGTEHLYNVPNQFYVN